MESKPIITEDAAKASLAEAQLLEEDVYAHSLIGLEAHADSKLLVGTPYLDDAGKIVSSDTFRFRTVKDDRTTVLVDVPVFTATGQPVTNWVTPPDPPEPIPDNSEPVIEIAGSGGSNDGCLPRMTSIALGGGSFKRIEELKVGDLILSYDLAGLSQLEQAWLSFRTANLKAKETRTRVQGVAIARFDRFYVFSVEGSNAKFRVTFEHLVLYQRDWLWRFGHAEEIQVGDYLAVGLAAKKVVSREEVKLSLTTYNLDVEPYDIYVADGVLVHNSQSITK